ncbi:MAG: hypothetical protein ACRD2F_11410, partial [Terriglobales bacterium]
AAIPVAGAHLGGLLRCPICRSPLRVSPWYVRTQVLIALAVALACSAAIGLAGALFLIVSSALFFAFLFILAGPGRYAFPPPLRPVGPVFTSICGAPDSCGGDGGPGPDAGDAARPDQSEKAPDVT